MNHTVHGILQARILQWVAILFSRGLPNPGIEPRSPSPQVDSLPAEPPGKPKLTNYKSFNLERPHWISSNGLFSWHVLITQLCLTLSQPYVMGCSLPGSSVHGIFQARILEQVAISSSRVSSQLRYWTWVFCISCFGMWILYHWTTWEVPSKTLGRTIFVGQIYGIANPF